MSYMSTFSTKIIVIYSPIFMYFRQPMAAAGVALGAGKKAALAALGAFSGVGAAVAYKLDQSVKADLTLHPPHLSWSHSGLIDSLDHASIRRGYQVRINLTLPSSL